MQMKFADLWYGHFFPHTNSNYANSLQYLTAYQTNKLDMLYLKRHHLDVLFFLMFALCKTLSSPYWY